MTLGVCLDPHLEGASGLGKLALRSLGIDADGISEKEKAHRAKLKVKIRGELMPYAGQAEPLIQGLKPHESTPESELLVLPISYKDLAIIAEKIARGCEYQLKGRYTDPPYGIRIFTSDPHVLPHGFQDVAQSYTLGPGCKILRASDPRNPYIVIYKLLLWETLCFTINIDFEADLLEDERLYTRPSGFTREELEKRRKAVTDAF